jgi:TolA-binding protein
MQKLSLLLVLFLHTTLYGLTQDQIESEYNAILKASNTVKLEQVIKLNALYIKAQKSNAALADQILLKMGQIALDMEPSLEAFNQKREYRNICHLRIVKSANYGDFAAYDGYHFKKIIQNYPKSKLVDDAFYHLIYVSEDVNNYTDLKKEQQKLEDFIKKYPKSNLLERAKNRIEFIKNHLKNGGIRIID